LTDEASHELLLLDSCADAALEVAFMEHGDRLWYDIRVVVYAEGVVVFVFRVGLARAHGIVIGTLAFLSPDTTRTLPLADVNATTSSPKHLQPLLSHWELHSHGPVKNTLESLPRHCLEADNINRSTAPTMGLHKLLAPTDQAIQHLPPAAAKAVLTTRR
jgi:hypothetical protein